MYNNKKKIIIIVMMALIMIMATGYAYFATKLNVQTTANITGQWNVVFTKAEVVEKTTGASQTQGTTPQLNQTSMEISVDLNAPGDYIVYELTISNLGTVDAFIDDMHVSVSTDNAIKFDVSEISSDPLLAVDNGAISSTTVTVKAYYDTNATEKPTESTELKLTILARQYVEGGYEDDVTIPTDGTLLSTAILNDNEEIDGSNLEFDAYWTSDNGLYYTSTNTENNKVTYFFRGNNVENNYVQLEPTETITIEKAINENTMVEYESMEACQTASPDEPYRCLSQSTTEYVGGLVFRIVRINEDGSVRLVYYGPTTDSNWKSNSNIDYSVYNVLNSDNAFVGYMHGKATYIDGHKTYSSTSSYASLSTTKTVKMSSTYTFNSTTGMYTLGTTVDGNYTSEYYNYYTCMSETETTCATMIKLTSASVNGNYNYVYGADIYQAYFSTSHETAHANEVDSTIKIAIDKWYEDNLKSKYSAFLADAGFCNDRSVAPSAGLWHADDTKLGYGQNVTYYGGYYRVSNHQPQFKCPNEIDDLFTTSSSLKGNNALKYPIGLMTADEVAYAGVSLYGESNAYVLDTWTMSPNYYGGLNNNYKSSVMVLTSGKGEMLGYDTSSNYAHFRPVINLKANVVISGGNGTAATPYIIKTS